MSNCGTGNREGPVASYRCVGCKYHNMDGNGVGGVDHWCEHPDVKTETSDRKYMNYGSSTPEWCPYLAE